jgi:tetratricopeptide (TPR) repeat protein
VKRALVVGSLWALFAWPGRAADPAPATDTNITIDPAIAQASADADADTAHPAGAEPVSASSGEAQTPYEKALLNYKAGKYDAAKVLIDDADQTTPGKPAIELLKVRILAELHDFHGAHQELNSIYQESDLTPSYLAALTLTNGDLNLRERHFEEAAKAYESYLQNRPTDTDAKLKLVYAKLGVGDLITAGKLASEFQSSDAATPAYYFAHAALAHAGATTGDEEQDFEQARTIYGITLTNRYLKTYLEVFSPEKGAGSDAATPNAAKPAPSGKAQ